MASTYSTNLGIELPGTGDQAGVWGNTTNTNLGTLIEQAISGYVTQAVATGTDTTITIPNGATGVARNMYIELTGTGGASTNLIVPANKKLYFIFNNTSSGQVTVKVSGQTGISVPNGKKMVLVSNGTDIVTAENYVASLSSDNLSLTGTLAVGSTSTFTGAATFTANPTLSGGTANGVLYLNGSKVATSGSALVFDGTNLSATRGLKAASSGVAVSSFVDGLNVGGYDSIGFLASPGNALAIGGYRAAQWNGIEFYAAGALQATLNPTGLGIGTATPSAKLEVRSANSDTITDLIWAQQYNAAGTDRALFTLQADAANNLINLKSTGTNAGGFTFISGADEVMRLSSSGNLSVGPTGVTGADGISVASGKNFSFGEGSGASYTNLFRQANSGATVLANGYKYSSTANGFASSLSSSWAKSAVVLGYGTGDIRFYTDTTTTVANGTDVTPTLRAVLDNAGNLTLGMGGSAAAYRFHMTDTLGFRANSVNIVGMKGSGFGYGPSGYQALVIGATGTTNQSTCIGYDPSGNPSGNFSGDGSEIVLRNFAQFIQPTAANTNFHRGVISLRDGNVGIQSDPTGWSGYGIIQIGDNLSSGLGFIGSDAAGSTVTDIGHGAYWDGSNWKYTANSIGAARYRMTGANAGSTHQWFTSAGGFAGNNISFGDAKMTLDASGNLGVGATSPSATFRATVQGVGTSGNPMGGILFRQGATDVFSISPISTDNTTDVEFWNYQNGYLRFGTNNTERGRFTAGGYFKASNDGTYVNATSTQHEFRGNTNSALVLFENRSASSPSGLYVDLSATSPNNTTQYFLYCEDSTAERATIRSNGGLANYSANNVNLSDERVKTDIKPLGSMWDKFKAIEIVTFKYKDQTHEDNNIGVIAQQVESVAPEFVDVDGWGETPEDGVPLKSIYSEDLHNATIKALQEAMARIESLEADMAALKGAK